MARAQFRRRPGWALEERQTGSKTGTPHDGIADIDLAGGRRVTMVIRCDRCGAELEAHLPERHAWARTWDAERGCMRHECPTCTGREAKKGKRRS